MKPWIWMSVKSLPREYRYKNPVTLQLWYDLVIQRIFGNANANDAQHIVLMASETIGRNVQCALSARLLFCVRINKTRKFNMASRTNQFGFTNLTRQSLFFTFWTMRSSFGLQCDSRFRLLNHVQSYYVQICDDLFIPFRSSFNYSFFNNVFVHIYQ